MMLIRAALIGLLFLFESGQAAANEYKLEEFARLPQVRDIGLSPNGTYFSSFVNAGQEVLLAVENLDNDDPPHYVRGPDWHMRWYEWITDTDLILSVGVPTKLGGTPVTVTRLVHVDVKKRTSKLMFQREDRRSFFQLQDQYLGKLPSEPGHFLIEAFGEISDLPHVYKVKVGDSKLRGAPYYRAKKNIHDWRVDNHGNVRAGFGFTANQKAGVAMLKDAQGKWHDYSGFAGGQMNLIALPTQSQDLAYVAVPDGEYDALHELHIPSRTLGVKIASHNQSDISSVRLNSAGDEIDIIHFESEAVPSVYQNRFLRQLKEVADTHFDDTANFIPVVSEDRSKAIIGAVSDTLPLHYYLYDKDTNSIDYLTATYPSLVDRAPGKIVEVKFQARDRLSIPAYLTIPAEDELSSLESIPFVIHPHGGPAARDFAQFDWTTQLLVAQGYGVMQINFRGSTGYGRAFQKAGQKQWGQAMQDDITDGTRWLIEQGYADPDRVCIYGGSYGGYAALMGAAKEPDLYQCAVSLNGVTDLRALLRISQQYIGGKFMTRHIGRLWKDRKMLNEHSPLRQVDAIKIPILLVHGEKDPVVPVSQSRRMRRALDDDQLYKYVELPDGDHSLTRQENRLTFARELVAFLGLHLGQSSARGHLDNPELQVQ